MAGFGFEPLWEPRVRLAGFESAAVSEPVVEMAGFELSNRRYLPTVSRLIPNSRAIRPRDQPPAAKVKIECFRLTLRMFIASICGSHRIRRNHHLKWLVFIRP